MKALNAFLDHDVVKEALAGDAPEAQRIIDDLMSLEVNIDDVYKELLQDGVVAFEKSFDDPLNSVEQKVKSF